MGKAGVKMPSRRTTKLDKAADKMLVSYAKQPRTHRLDGAHMPARSEITGIIQICERVLFPGYFGSVTLMAENIRCHVGGLLAELDRRLTEQIYRCLCYQRSTQADRTCPLRRDACRKEAQGLAETFLGKLEKVRDMLNLDVEAAYDGDPAAKSFDEIIFCYPGFQAVMVYRIAHVLHRLDVPLMPRIMTEYAHAATGTDIHPGAEIGERFFIDHATGVVIGETSVIGSNVKIYQGVTLGALSFPKDERGRVIKGLKRHPTLEDNVTVYANATILGGKTVIGKGATVGGNTFVISSVSADGSAPAAASARRARRKGPTRRR